MKNKIIADDEFEPIEMSQVLAILYLVPLGTILSVAIMIIEILKRKISKRRKVSVFIASRNQKLVFRKHLKIGHSLY